MGFHIYARHGSSLNPSFRVLDAWGIRTQGTKDGSEIFLGMGGV